MKATFSISASVTAPGTYETSHATRGGHLIIPTPASGEFEEDAIDAILAKLDEEYKTSRIGIEAALLEGLHTRRAAASDAAARLH